MRSNNIHIETGTATADALLHYLENREYEKIPSSLIIMQNNRYVTYRLKLPFLQGEQILKHHRPGKGYTLLRRISFFLRSWRTNYGERAFRGAIILKNAGVRSITPIACWTVRRGVIRESYFLYQRIAAEMSLHAYFIRTASGSGTDHKRLLQKMAETAVRLHNAHVFHGDLATHNFLVVDTGEAGESAHALALLDTDHVRRVPWIPLRGLGRIFHMHDLRRIGLSDQDRKNFLQCYLQSDDYEACLKVLLFWKWLDGRPFSKAVKRLMHGRTLPK